MVRGGERLRGDDRRAVRLHLRRRRPLPGRQHLGRTGLRWTGGRLRRPELRGLLGGRHRPRGHPHGQVRAHVRRREEPGLGGLRGLHLGDQRPHGAHGRGALYLRQEGDRKRGSRQRRRARQQLQLRVLHERRGQEFRQLGRLHPAPRAVLRPERRCDALRDRLARLQVRRFRDLRLRPARAGHQ